MPRPKKYNGTEKERRAKAVSEYNKNKVDRITFSSEKGTRQKLKDAASAAGLSVNAFINEAIKEKLSRE